MKAKIQQLLASGIDQNIELAFQLIKGQDISTTELLGPWLSTISLVLQKNKCKPFFFNYKNKLRNKWLHIHFLL